MPQLLTETQRTAFATAHPDWQTTATHLSRTVKFRTFSQAWAFMSRVALLAEKHDHHPDWSNSYGTVTVTLTTHAAGGLTERDTTLATAIDGVVGG